MNTYSNNENQPLLAICIPTYNRASSLYSLLSSLCVLKERFGNQIEICISNNASTDNTSEVIREFSSIYEIVIHNQKSNVGSTHNIIKVAGMMTAHWGIWCGDDDEINIDSIEHILAKLRILPRETWLLVESTGLNGNEQYLNHFNEGGYSAVAFRYAVFCRGLDSFGFMGVHIFPRSSVSALQALGADTRPWPPTVSMLLFITRPDVKVYIMRETVVLQAKGGTLLYWSAGDLVQLHLSKIRLIKRVYFAIQEQKLFLYGLMVRELYSIEKIKLLMLWKLCERTNFKRQSEANYCDAYKYFGNLKFLTIPHHIFLKIINNINYFFYKNFFIITKKIYLRELYIKQKKKYRTFDGTRRGL